MRKSALLTKLAFGSSKLTLSSFRRRQTVKQLAWGGGYFLRVRRDSWKFEANPWGTEVVCHTEGDGEKQRWWAS